MLGEAKAVPAKHIVVLSHVPPFVEDEDEPTGWATWEREPREAVLAVAAEAGATLWLCGHFHGNAYTMSRGNIEIVVTSSCCSTINRSIYKNAVARTGRYHTN